MGRNDQDPWVGYLEGDCLNSERAGGGRPYQVVVRIRAEGLQAVVKVRAGEQYLVCFVGAGTLSSLAGKVRDALKEEGGRWREDSYPPT